MANPLKNVYEKLTHIHMVVYTWWCWHICKGEKVGEEKGVECAGHGVTAAESLAVAASETHPVELEPKQVQLRSHVPGVPSPASLKGPNG